MKDHPSGPKPGLEGNSARIHGTPWVAAGDLDVGRRCRHSPGRHPDREGGAATDWRPVGVHARGSRRASSAHSPSRPGGWLKLDRKPSMCPGAGRGMLGPALARGRAGAAHTQGYGPDCRTLLMAWPFLGEWSGQADTLPEADRTGGTSDEKLRWMWTNNLDTGEC